jgi:hypothetical protein
MGGQKESKMKIKLDILNAQLYSRIATGLVELNKRSVSSIDFQKYFSLDKKEALLLVALMTRAGYLTKYYSVWRVPDTVIKSLKLSWGSGKSVVKNGRIVL